MATIVVLHNKHMKLAKPFIPMLLRAALPVCFFEAKFVIFWLFLTPLAFLIFEKRPNEMWLFLSFFVH